MKNPLKEAMDSVKNDVFKPKILRDMKSLEKEATEYDAQTEWSKYEIEKAFIAGANSDYVKRKIIENQIEVLNKIYSDNKTSDFNSSTFQDIEYEINQLEQQLKELEQ